VSSMVGLTGFEPATP